MPQPYEILDGDVLLRRVLYTHPSYIRDDGRPTSLAFKLRKDEEGLSVDIKKFTTYRQSIQDKTKFRLFALIAKRIRLLELECSHAPLADNEAHALITGNITTSKARSMAREAKRIWCPD